jgi:predicted O-methyltransferase YrrM
MDFPTIRKVSLRDFRQRSFSVMSSSSETNQVGWPSDKPSTAPYMYGWFWPSNQAVLKTVLSADTKIIVELGSFLGKSTRFMAECAPNAQIYAVDLWSNEFILTEHGDHYNSSDLNMKVLTRIPLYETFLANFWDVKDRLTPVRMTTEEGLDYLKNVLKIPDPDVIYVDADHHYDGAMRDIRKSLELFPNALLVGDDFDYEGVRKAVEEYAGKNGKTVHVEGNKCWVYKKLTVTKDSVKKAAPLLPERLCKSFDRICYAFKKSNPSASSITDDFKRNPELLNSTNPKRKGKTLLMEAVETGNVDAVKILVRAGAEVNTQAPKSGQSALILAAYHGHEEIVEYLLRKGADPSLKNHYGETARDAAATNFKTKCVQMLDPTSPSSPSSGSKRKQEPEASPDPKKPKTQE